MPAISVCAPRNLREVYAEWLDLTDGQVALFKRLEKRARVIRKAVRDQILRPLGATVYCSYCGEMTATQIDHRIPIIQLGDSRISNLVAACGDCNMRKGTKNKFVPPTYTNTDELYTRELFGVVRWERTWSVPGYPAPDPQEFVLLDDY